VKIERLRAMREAAGLTQAELARLANTAETSVVRAEHGEGVRVTTARRLADALGVRVGDLQEDAPPVPLGGKVAV